jgi:hypothetical protein
MGTTLSARRRDVVWDDLRALRHIDDFRSVLTDPRRPAAPVVSAGRIVTDAALPERRAAGKYTRSAAAEKTAEQAAKQATAVTALVAPPRRLRGPY